MFLMSEVPLYHKVMHFVRCIRYVACTTSFQERRLGPDPCFQDRGLSRARRQSRRSRGATLAPVDVMNENPLSQPTLSLSPPGLGLAFDELCQVHPVRRLHTRVGVNAACL